MVTKRRLPFLILFIVVILVICAEIYFLVFVPRFGNNASSSVSVPSQFRAVDPKKAFPIGQFQYSKDNSSLLFVGILNGVSIKNGQVLATIQLSYQSSGQNDITLILSPNTKFKVNVASQLVDTFLPDPNQTKPHSFDQENAVNYLKQFIGETVILSTALTKPSNLPQNAPPISPIVASFFSCNTELGKYVSGTVKIQPNCNPYIDKVNVYVTSF